MTCRLLFCTVTYAALCWLNYSVVFISSLTSRTIERQTRTDTTESFPLFDHSYLLHVSSQRSHSAFSLLDNDPPGLIQDSPQTLKKEGGGSAMSTWKSVDRLDNAGEIFHIVASVFTSHCSFRFCCARSVSCLCTFKMLNLL